MINDQTLTRSLTPGLARPHIDNAYVSKSQDTDMNTNSVCGVRIIFVEGDGGKSNSATPTVGTMEGENEIKDD